MPATGVISRAVSLSCKASRLPRSTPAHRGPPGPAASFSLQPCGQTRAVSLLCTLVAYRSAVSRKSCLLSSSKASTSCWIRVRSGRKRASRFKSQTKFRKQWEEKICCLIGQRLGTACIFNFPPQPVLCISAVFPAQQRCEGTPHEHLPAAVSESCFHGLGFCSIYLLSQIQSPSLKRRMPPRPTIQPFHATRVTLC